VTAERQRKARRGSRRQRCRERFSAAGHSGPAAPTVVRTKSSSGRAPRISTVSFATVFGTPLTWYLRTRSGYSLASTMEEVTCPLSTAMRFARLTARGQCGQVGVTNTWSASGDWICPMSARLASVRPESPADTSLMASMSDMNS